MVVAGVVWGATEWLLREADQAKDPAAARVEAIKTGLSIGAGAGGVLALLLAVRRQWHQELSSAATELVDSHRDSDAGDQPFQNSNLCAPWWITTIKPGDGSIPRVGQRRRSARCSFGALRDIAGDFHLDFAVFGALTLLMFVFVARGVPTAVTTSPG